MNQSGAQLKSQPWRPSDATDNIRALSKTDALTLSWTGHAKHQMSDRDLIVSDVLHVLKYGYIYDEPEKATQNGYFKYKMESSSPAGSRVVRVVVIPCQNPPELKIVTVMWRDEV
jgi:hypothetical protein